MKRILLAAMLCLFLLGCGQTAPAEAPNRLIPTKDTENDTLRSYRTDGAECRFFVLGEDLLLLQTKDGAASLLCFTGKTMTQSASFALEAGSTVQVAETTVLCYEPESRQAIALDDTLQEQARLTLPEGTTGTPFYHEGILFYCTEDALMAAEFDTGIHRTLRRSHDAGLLPTAVFGEVLVCTSETESLFLRVEDGTTLGSGPKVVSSGKKALAIRCGSNDCLYLGDTMLPLPPGWRFLAFTPDNRRALLCREGDTTELGIYDLSTGNRTAQLVLTGIPAPEQAAVMEDGRVFFQTQGAGCLYQWTPDFAPARDSRLQICPLSTAESPDSKALEQCRKNASGLETRYGLSILLNTEVPGASPQGCTIVPEHLAVMVEYALTQIEKSLALYPQNFIRQAASGTGRTYLCPVRSIQKGGEELDCLQYWCGNDSYLYIAVTERAGSSSIRALSAMMDDRIVSVSSVFDSWEALNPEGFRYGPDAAGDRAYFADSRSVLSPVEDRAGILLTAMESGNRELYCSAMLQAKLRRLSTALREVYSLSGTLPWEQYLWEPLG